MRAENCKIMKTREIEFSLWQYSGFRHNRIDFPGCITALEAALAKFLPKLSGQAKRAVPALQAGFFC